MYLYSLLQLATIVTRRRDCVLRSNSRCTCTCLFANDDEAAATAADDDGLADWYLGMESGDISHHQLLRNELEVSAKARTPWKARLNGDGCGQFDYAFVEVRY